ncbi:carboxylesterase family protein [Microbulbifer agarilyticus]|uniref:carboxylesterase family protein n=1 Tax=Microbulbifer agarilyticus TaxID=260552 RepID=UPI001CD248BE|nr:alpha/beta fold hydrolase [Microbulbifer agarilyticus]MCA0894367.1 prolyl oligopeptidase family serine peptidase [Microbulbifer agarilyticus]
MQKTVSDGQLNRQSYISEVDGAEREYFVYLPRGYSTSSSQQWPLMLFLHGNGERGDGRQDLDFVLMHGPLYEVWAQKRDLPFIIIAPQLHMFGMDKKFAYIANRSRDSIPSRQEQGTPERTYFSPIGEMQPGEMVDEWGQVAPLLPDGWERGEQDLLNILQHTAERLRVDQSRIYLTGISYGGFGTWYMASRHPQKFAAIAPVVGWGHPDFMPPIAEASLPVWAFAGGRDTAVQKSHFFGGINKLEQESDAEVRFTIHEDMAHDVWRRVYEGQDIYDWLLKQRRESPGQE